MNVSLQARIADIPASDWNMCAGLDNPFVSHAFLSAIEDSGSTGKSTGWLPRHIAVHDQQGRLIAAAPAYVKTHSYGEYVFDQGWAEALERAGGQYYPKLQVAVPFSPVPGPRILLHPSSTVTVPVIADCLERVCGQLKLSSAHVTFCQEDEWRQLAEAGWLQRLGVQYHWTNDGYGSFDDFLDLLSSRKRKSIRRERRDAQSAGLDFVTLRGVEIEPQHWAAFHRFYVSTVDRKWGSAYLTPEFFPLLSQYLGDRVVLMMARHGAEWVAGALNLAGADTLYGRNWGCIGDWPFLHFELCYYRAIDYAIAHGLKRVEAGAQGQHKIQRGYLPQPTYSAHWIGHPGLRSAVAAYLEQERPSVQAEMADLAELSPFRHAGEEN